MKKLFFIIIVFALNINVSVSASEWNQQKGTHFIVYYTGNHNNFAQRVLQRAENDYSRIANYLGYARSSNFWTWNNRVKVYLHPDQEAYSKATNKQQWSQGMANYDKKEISSFVKNKYFIESILPHEIAHLIFRDFVGFKGQVPLWLDEGVAQWAELEKRTYIRSLTRQYLKEKKLISFETMMKLDIRELKEGNMINMSFLSDKSGRLRNFRIKGGELVKIYYVQAASIVGFLIERFGTGRFAVFCRNLRDGSSLNKALRLAYPANVDNMQTLQEAWLDYIDQ